MTQTLRAGLFVWGGWIGLFLLYELPAHFGWVPWPTLSRTCWDAESSWGLARLILLAFLLVLAVHIVFRLSAAALIAVAVCAAIALVVHLATGYL